MSVKVVSSQTNQQTNNKKVNQHLGCKMFSGNFQREALKSNSNKNTRKVTETQ